MKKTTLATLMIFAAYFLLLYGTVGFIQDKRFFASAPKENLAPIPDKKECFPGAHIIGWVTLSPSHSRAFLARPSSPRETA